MRVTFKISNMKSLSWGIMKHSCQQFFVNYLKRKCCLYSIRITHFLKHNNMLEQATWKFIRQDTHLMTFWRISRVTMLLLEWLIWRMWCMSAISAMMEFLHTPSNLMTRWDFGLVICGIQKQVYLTVHFSFQVRKTWMKCPMIFSLYFNTKRAIKVHYCVAVGE